MNNPKNNADGQPDTDPRPVLPLAADQSRFFRWFFFAIFAFLIYQLLLILGLFSDVIIWAVSLTLVFWPAYKVIQRRLVKRPSLAPAVGTLAVFLLVLIPVIVVFSIVVDQSAQLAPTIELWITTLQTDDRSALLDLLPEFLRNGWAWLTSAIASTPLLAEFDPAEVLLGNANSISAMLANLGAAALGNILFGLVNILLILILMYFCFRDGERFLAWFLSVIPMESSHAQVIAGRIYQTVTAVIRGALITSSVQGILATLGYLLADVPLALFFGVLTGFAALIPVVGAGLIWLPIGLFEMTRDPVWGIFILVWGFFVVSMIDNLLKPIIVGNQTRMPILLIFCAMIGGANVYGVTGFIIGPILVAVLLAFITIYREYYLPG